VRQNSMHIWKIVVPNTPRLLREILPTLLASLINNLASKNGDKRKTAAKTLGDVVRKLGERTLPDLIPILERNLSTAEPTHRQGVCIGLSEIIKACSRDAISSFTDSLVPAIRKALCDELDDVREAAATTFENLHDTIGITAIEGVLPPMLKKLASCEGREQELVVDGLKQIIAVKGRHVLPQIVPKLIEEPVNTEMLALLSSVAGESLNRYLASILNALINTLSKCESTEDYNQVLKDSTMVVLSVEDDHGQQMLMQDLIHNVKSQHDECKFAAVQLLDALIENGSVSNLSDYYSVFIHEFIRLLADKQEKIQRSSWQALNQVVKSMESSEMTQFIGSVQNAFNTVKNEKETLKNEGHVPGLCLPKLGLTPVIPILREGLLNGSGEMKEMAARTMIEGVKLLTPIALKHSVVSISGPLIRIMGDRFGNSVRIAVLDCLALLLEKVGLYLKPFLPQLSTSFMKALTNDQDRKVRIHAARALQKLLKVHSKVDSIFTDFKNNIGQVEDDSYRETYLLALRLCIQSGGKKMKANIKTELLEMLEDHVTSDCDVIATLSAGCLASLLKYVEQDQLEQVFQNHMQNANCSSASWEVLQTRSTLVAVAMKESYDQVCLNHQNEIVQIIQQFTSVDRVQIVNNGIRAAVYMILHQLTNDDEQIVNNQLVDCLKKGLQHALGDVKIESCRSISWMSHQIYNLNKKIPFSLMKELLSDLLQMCRERNIMLRSSSETAVVTMFSMHTQQLSVFNEYADEYEGKESSALQELYQSKLKKVAANSQQCEEITIL